MISILIVAHGNLGVEFVKVAEDILGPQEAFEAFALAPDDHIESVRPNLKACVDRLQETSKAISVEGQGGVIILTDMFGGTPSNLALSFLDMPRIEIVAGINLPMLIKLLKDRTKKPLLELAIAGQESGQRYITVASSILQAQNSK